MTKDEIKTWLSNAEPLCGMLPLSWGGRPVVVVPDTESTLGFSVLDATTNWTKLDAVEVLKTAEPVTWQEYRELWEADLHKHADRLAQQFIESIRQTVAEQGPPPTAQDLADKTAEAAVKTLNEKVAKLPPAPAAADLERYKLRREGSKYPIAAVNRGGNVIKIDVTVQDDGGLQIFDLSYGPVADECYGEGRDVEHWLDITPEATRELSVKLFRDWVEDPADEVAKHLETRFLGDTRAVSKIRALLDELDVPYERHLWP